MEMLSEKAEGGAVSFIISSSIEKIAMNNHCSNQLLRCTSI